jgi:mono/diheme cytochrome c family protein
VGRAKIKRMVITVLLASGSILFLSALDSPQDRRDADLKAKTTFSNLTFFAEGRGMHVVPGLIEVFNRFRTNPFGAGFGDIFIHQHWGFNVQHHWPVGLFDVEYKGLHVGALGCVACHSAKAAGIFIVGLGNKNIDVVRVGKDVAQIDKIYSTLHPEKENDPNYLTVRNSAIEFANVLSNQKLGNITQGMVPVSFIRYWFYKQAGLPVPDDMAKGAIKIPSLWGYEEKKKVGQFSDGYGNGNFPGWAIAVELTGGQEPKTVHSYLGKVEAAENLFSDFLPPPYPYTIDSQKADRGKITFTKTCAGCHGTYEYDGQGLPIYKSPKFIPLQKVNTDDDRLAANTPFFDHLVETSPLNDIIKHNSLGRGYFAPRLVGIWSRFPYLHNGSAPNVMTLLTQPEFRTRIFSVRDAGEEFRFDRVNLGLKTLTVYSEFQSDPTEPEEAELITRTTYNTNDVGHGNTGHSFGLTLTHDEKLDLIEYLKTL